MDYNAKRPVNTQLFFLHNKYCLVQSMVGKASLQDAAHYPPFQLFLAALWMLQASSTNQESEHIFKCVPLQLVVCALGKPASVQGGNKNNRKGRV